MADSGRSDFLPLGKETRALLLHFFRPDDCSRSPPLTAAEVERTIGRAKTNKVATGLVKHLAATPDHVTPEGIEPLTKHLERVTRREKSTAELLVRISEIFSERSIPYSVFKTMSDVGRDHSDIDIIVGCDLDGVVASLSELNPVVVEREVSKAKVKCLAFSDATPLDLHLRVTQDEITFLEDRELLPHTEVVELGITAVRVLRSRDQLLAFAVEALFGDSILRVGDLLEIRSLAGDKRALDEAFREATKYGWGEPFAALVRLARTLHCPTVDFGVLAPLMPLTSRRKGLELPAFIPFTSYARWIAKLWRTQVNSNISAFGSVAKLVPALRRQAGARLYKTPIWGI